MFESQKKGFGQVLEKNLSKIRYFYPQLQTKLLN